MDAWQAADLSANPLASKLFSLVRKIKAARIEIDAMEQAVESQQKDIAQRPTQILAQAFAPQEAHHD